MTAIKEKGNSLVDACTLALNFLSADASVLKNQPIIKALREALSEVVIPHHVPKDKADVQYFGENPENPRILANLPAGMGYWNMLPPHGDLPAFVLVLARADRQEVALGCLEAAKHGVNVFNDMQTVQRLKFTHGIDGANLKLGSA